MAFKLSNSRESELQFDLRPASGAGLRARRRKFSFAAHGERRTIRESQTCGSWKRRGIGSEEPQPLSVSRAYKLELS